MSKFKSKEGRAALIHFIKTKRNAEGVIIIAANKTEGGLDTTIDSNIIEKEWLVAILKSVLARIVSL